MTKKTNTTNHNILRNCLKAFPYYFSTSGGAFGTVELGFRQNEIKQLAQSQGREQFVESPKKE